MGLTSRQQEQVRSGHRPGNLGSTLIKRSYLFLEIVLQFVAIADLAARLDARWAVKMDRPYIISMFSLLGTACLINIFLVFYLAFNNVNIPPSRKDLLRRYRPIVEFLLLFPCCFLVRVNHMHILFPQANSVFLILSGIHFHYFLTNDMVNILSTCIPCMKEYETADRGEIQGMI